jgi:hypothetical protein
MPFKNRSSLPWRGRGEKAMLWPDKGSGYGAGDTSGVGCHGAGGDVRTLAQAAGEILQPVPTQPMRR